MAMTSGILYSTRSGTCGITVGVVMIQAPSPPCFPLLLPGLGPALLARRQPVSAPPVTVRVGAQARAAERLGCSARGLALLALGSAAHRLGVLGVAHAKSAIGPGDHVVLAVGPGPVSCPRVSLVGAQGLGYLSPARPGLERVIALVDGLVRAGQVLSGGQQLQVLGGGQRLGAPGAVPGRVVRARGCQLRVGASQVLAHAQLVAALPGSMGAGAVAPGCVVIGDRVFPRRGARVWRGLIAVIRIHIALLHVQPGATWRAYSPRSRGRPAWEAG